MSDNTGDMEHNSTALSSSDMTYEGHGDSYKLQVAGHRNPGATVNLRGVEENTNESKGVVYSCPPPTGEPHPEGEACQIEEST
jgi:hypothetical protein